jgi:endonuclease IV
VKQNKEEQKVHVSYIFNINSKEKKKKKKGIARFVILSSSSKLV